MRRRFGRGRRRGSAGAPESEPIDAASCFERLQQAGHVPAEGLSIEAPEDVPNDLAALARVEADGASQILSFSPTSGGDAVLAGLGHGLRQEVTPSEIVAISPVWSSADRRRLGLAAPDGVALRPLAVPELGEQEAVVAPESSDGSIALSVEHVAAGVRPGDRDLFLRAVAGLEGLAAKHGGTVRGGQRRRRARGARGPRSAPLRLGEPSAPGDPGAGSHAGRAGQREPGHGSGSTRRIPAQAPE